MITRKLLFMVRIIVAADYATPVLGMSTADIQYRAQNIINLRNQINKKRKIFSIACSTGSTIWALSAGLLTGLFYYNHNVNFPHFLQPYSPTSKALIAGAGIMLVNAATSWLTKHWGIYHFFTHNGGIKRLKSKYKNLCGLEDNERRTTERINADNLSAIANLEDRINRFTQQLERICSTRQDRLNEEIQRVDAIKQQVQMGSATVELLHAHPPIENPVRNQQIEPDPALQGGSWEDLEQQLMNELQTARDENSYRTHWIRIQQFLFALVNSVVSDATHPQEISKPCQQSLLPILRLALIYNSAIACKNLACLGLKLFMLKPYVDDQFFQNLHTSNNLIIPLLTDADCPICFENYTDKSLIRILPCGHSMCNGCMTKITGTCPECMQPI